MRLPFLLRRQRRSSRLVGSNMRRRSKSSLCKAGVNGRVAAPLLYSNSRCTVMYERFGAASYLRTPSLQMIAASYVCEHLIRSWAPNSSQFVQRLLMKQLNREQSATCPTPHTSTFTELAKTKPLLQRQTMTRCFLFNYLVVQRHLMMISIQNQRSRDLCPKLVLEDVACR